MPPRVPVREPSFSPPLPSRKKIHTNDVYTENSCVGVRFPAVGVARASANIKFDGGYARMRNAKAGRPFVNIKLSGECAKMRNAEADKTFANIKFDAGYARMRNAKAGRPFVNIKLSGECAKMRNAEADKTFANIKLGGEVARMLNVEGGRASVNTRSTAICAKSVTDVYMANSRCTATSVQTAVGCYVPLVPRRLPLRCRREAINVQSVTRPLGKGRSVNVLSVPS